MSCLAIQVLHLHESADAVAGELKITLDATTKLFVVDVIAFNADGRIRSVRAYLGRGSFVVAAPRPHSTVTLLARLRGLSTSVPRAQAVW